MICQGCCHSKRIVPENLELLEIPRALQYRQDEDKEGLVKIKQIYHIGLPCNDLERATKFYTDVLGMKCTKVGFDTESGGPYKDVYGMFPEISRLFMEDGMCLVLFQRPKPIERGDFDEGTSHIALEVSSDDFDQAADELKKAGVKVLIDKPVVRPTGKAIYFFDPEMNYIQLWSKP